MIYARSRNYCIGKNADLPWHLPDEFAHYLHTTRGFPRIMGRRSFEDQDASVASGTNIVVTSRPRSTFPAEIITANTLDEAINHASRIHQRAFVIGGASLLSAAFSLSDEVFETIVKVDIDGDTFVPRFDFSDWESTLLRSHPIDEQHKYAFDIFRHRREKSADL